jgi:hypothetical protein
VAAAVFAWLFAYLGLGPFLAAFLTGCVAAFQSGLDKYSQLPQDPRPTPRAHEPDRREYTPDRQSTLDGDARGEPRRRFPSRLLLLILVIIVLLLAGIYIYWVVAL